MNEAQEKDEKLYYSIGEVAEMFEVNTSLIRFWEKEFDAIKPSKNKKGNRLFTQQDVALFKTIFFLVKEKGYKLQGAKQMLKDNSVGVNTELEIVEKLKKIRAFLVSMKQEL
jgi:DNA-binding transcriptional MerR regulator